MDGAALNRVTRLVDLEFPRGRVPDLDDTVERGKAQPGGIRTERGSKSILRFFAAKRKYLPPHVPVPDLKRAIVTSRQHGLAVGTEGHAPDPRGVLGGYAYRLPIGHVPQSHSLVRPAGCQRP